MGEHRRGPPFRPPWWPENEPFPPAGPGGWHRGRRRFVRRVAVIFVVFFGLTFAASTLAVGALTGALGGERSGLILPGAFLGLLLLVILAITTARIVRRTAAPIGDVLEAADRVAGGDYSVRVSERGAGEVRRLTRSFNTMVERLGTNEARRRSLLADVTHELRTPLSVIQGNTEAMIDGLYPPDKSHLEPVLEETHVMSRLLDDLFTLSTAEAGVLRLHREAVDPARLSEDAVAAFKARAVARGVTLEVNAPAGLPDVDADPIRIGEVLSNLLSNALRHTPSDGTVSISVALGEDDRVVFAVEDTGPGIEPEELERVFDRFVKSADSGGVGLGLAIAKSFVEAHGGDIAAANRPGGGASIRFRLAGAG